MILARSENDQFINKFFISEQMYDISIIKNIGKSYITLNYFSTNPKFNLEFEDFIKIVVIPFNHRIKKFKFILTLKDLSSILYNIFDKFKN